MKFLEQEDKVREGKTALGNVFVTMGLVGSLADEAVLQLKEEMDMEIRSAETEEQSASRIRRIEKVYFGKIDNLLDNSSIGPKWLKKYDLAKLVIRDLEEMAKNQIKLICYSVLPNHLHLVFSPTEIDNRSGAVDAIENFKQQTAIKANALLNIQGEFWIRDHHFYDIHDNGELINIISYILENPVKAGLVDYWRDWPWSYCNPDYL